MTEEEFDALRPSAFAIAYRMLGSVSEAEDVVQEGSCACTGARGGERIESPRAYLATVVSRLSLDHLRSARRRPRTPRRKPVTTSPNTVSPRGGLVDALHVPGPATDLADKLMLFGRFVGSWELKWTGTDPAGQPATMHGELHFGWVLGGRAVQDIWIVPGRGQPGEGRRPQAFHGSTIRFYDPAIDAWRSTWIEPVNGRVRRFIGRPEHDDIILLSDEEDPQLRWRFTDITPDSFRWHAEISHDACATWSFDEEMLATRRPPA